MATCSKPRVTEEELGKDDLKESRVGDSEVERGEGPGVEGDAHQASKSEEVKAEVDEEGKEAESAVKEFIIGKALFTVHETVQKDTLGIYIVLLVMTHNLQFS